MNEEHLAEAASAWLDSLPEGARAAARFPFDADLRQQWAYTPGPRPGVSLGEMEAPAAKALHRLVALVLSPTAYARVAAIVALEDVLDEQEGGRLGRHAGNYWGAVFGEPGKAEPWGWRFEGHHVSVNVMVDGDRVATTPLFLGANPARLNERGTALLQPLAPEENLAALLVDSLDARQRQRATLGGGVPADILTRDQPLLEGPLEPLGLPGADLASDQHQLLAALVAVYLERLTAGLAGPRLARLPEELDEVHFAWAGEPGVVPGRPRYYRLQGPGLLVELDNTQNEANHVHTVWRDPVADFGAEFDR